MVNFSYLCKFGSVSPYTIFRVYTEKRKKKKDECTIYLTLNMILLFELR